MFMIEDEPSFVGEYDSHLEAKKILNKLSEDVGKNQTINLYIESSKL